MNPAAVIASGGTGLIQGLVNYEQQKEFNANQRDFAREQATTAYNRQKELLEQMQRFDSPANQMYLLAAAGINPNLAAGGSIGGVPSAPAVSQGNVPNAVAPQMSLGLGDIADRMAQVERLNVQNKNDTSLSSAQVEPFYQRYHQDQATSEEQQH